MTAARVGVVSSSQSPRCSRATSSPWSTANAGPLPLSRAWLPATRAVEPSCSSPPTKNKYDRKKVLVARENVRSAKGGVGCRMHLFRSHLPLVSPLGSCRLNRGYACTGLCGGHMPRTTISHPSRACFARSGHEARPPGGEGVSTQCGHTHQHQHQENTRRFYSHTHGMSIFFADQPRHSSIPSYWQQSTFMPTCIVRAQQCCTRGKAGFSF